MEVLTVNTCMMGNNLFKEVKSGAGSTHKESSLAANSNSKDEQQTFYVHPNLNIQSAVFNSKMVEKLW
jgi:hypothetical protein